MRSVDALEAVEGLMPGVDRRVLRQLRRGHFKIAARLDLHGQTKKEAHQNLLSFVDRSRRDERRAVLIIHGRGLHSSEGGAVLKTAVVRWLTETPLARAVLAFCPAQPKDGGLGALYVLLRRREGPVE
jgi:DNA-nicking Smr family endonuclease